MPKPTFDSPATIIATDEALAEMVLTLRGFDRIAIDTESDGYYRYRPKLCLIQMTAGGVDYIIDPLSIENLSPLGLLFGDPNIEKLFHSGPNDLPILRDAAGSDFVAPYVDTQIAAQVAGIKGIGLGSLTKEFLGVTLDKKYQLHDWGARPFDPQATQYARADSHYLEALWDILWPMVLEKGRVAHFKEECLRALDTPTPVHSFDPEACLSIKGSKGLSPKELGILRAVYIERDALAEEADLAPFRILNNRALIELAQARRLPTSKRELKSIARIPPPTLASSSERILDALEAGFAQDAIIPSRPKRPREAKDPSIVARFDALKSWRKKASSRLKLDPSVIAPNGTLKALAKAKPDSMEALRGVDGVRGWQSDEFGEAWLKILSR